MTRFGTSNFVSKRWAIRYYVSQGYNRKEVNRKIKDGEISIGEPVVPDGMTLKVDNEEGRYFLCEDSQLKKRFIVMTAGESMPQSCWGKYGKVAVVETDGKTMPKQIHPKHKAVKRIVSEWRRQHIGKTEKCAFQVALNEAQELADQLNGE